MNAVIADFTTSWKRFVRSLALTKYLPTLTQLLIGVAAGLLAESFAHAPKLVEVIESIVRVRNPDFVVDPESTFWIATALVTLLMRLFFQGEAIAVVQSALGQDEDKRIGTITATAALEAGKAAGLRPKPRGELLDPVAELIPWDQAD